MKHKKHYIPAWEQGAIKGATIGTILGAGSGAAGAVEGMVIGSAIGAGSSLWHKKYKRLKW